MNIKAFVVSVFLLSQTVSCFSQGSSTSLEKVSEKLNAIWILTIGNDPKNEVVLKINEIAKKSDGVFSLNTLYGQIGGGQGSLKEAFFSLSGDVAELSFITQSGNKMKLSEVNSTLYEGTFTNVNGVSRNLKMNKISAEAFQLKEAPIIAEKQAKEAEGKAAKQAKTDSEAFIGPGPDIPQACAFYFGGWAGKWNIDQGPIRLWVHSIKPDCTAKTSYMVRESLERPPEFRTREISKDGTFSLSCGDNGICTFKQNGDELWGSYKNPFGGNNSIVLRRIK